MIPRVSLALRVARTRRTSLLRLLLVSLLLGAAANVAIAWTCVAREPDGFSIWRPPTPQHVSWWRSRVPSGFADVPDRASWRFAFGTGTVVLAAKHSSLPYPEGSDMGVWLRCGWPMHCLEGEIWAGQAPATPRHIWRPERISPHNYPLMPLPLGFAVNASLYAAAAFAMLLAARTCSRAERGSAAAWAAVCARHAPIPSARAKPAPNAVRP